MPQENCQKIKLLKLMEILRQETDEDHPLKTYELCERLVAMGISCDPRTLSRNIKLLNEYVNITDNTVKNVTLNCANLLEGKNHYETGKVVGDWNAPTGKYIGNTVTNVTIVNGSAGYTDNEIGAIESGCTVTGYGNGPV